MAASAVAASKAAKNSGVGGRVRTAMEPEATAAGTCVAGGRVRTAVESEAASESAACAATSTAPAAVAAATGIGSCSGRRNRMEVRRGSCKTMLEPLQCRSAHQPPPLPPNASRSLSPELRAPLAPLGAALPLASTESLPQRHVRQAPLLCKRSSSLSQTGGDGGSPVPLRSAALPLSSAESSAENTPASATSSSAPPVRSSGCGGTGGVDNIDAATATTAAAGGRVRVPPPEPTQPSSTQPSSLRSSVAPSDEVRKSGSIGLRQSLGLGTSCRASGSGPACFNDRVMPECPKQPPPPTNRSHCVSKLLSTAGKLTPRRTSMAAPKAAKEGGDGGGNNPGENSAAGGGDGGGGSGGNGRNGGRPGADASPGARPPFRRVSAPARPAPPPPNGATNPQVEEENTERRSWIQARINNVRRSQVTGGRRTDSSLSLASRWSNRPVSYTHLRAHETDSYL
eukprot:3686840-Pleurochrysis_carterae.AAC.1